MFVYLMATCQNLEFNLKAHWFLFFGAVMIVDIYTKVDICLKSLILK